MNWICKFAKELTILSRSGLVQVVYHCTDNIYLSQVGIERIMTAFISVSQTFTSKPNARLSSQAKRSASIDYV